MSTTVPTPDELRRLAEAATGGPWFYESGGAFCRYVVSQNTADNADVCCTLDSEEDAAFIVAARNALPGILDQLASKDAEIARLRTALELARPIVAEYDAYHREMGGHPQPDTLSAIDAALGAPTPEARK